MDSIVAQDVGELPFGTPNSAGAGGLGTVCLNKDVKRTDLYLA